MKQYGKIFFSVFVFIFFTCVSVFAQDYSTFKLDNGHTVIIKEVKNGKVYTVESNGGSIINKTYDADKVCSVARVVK